MTRIAGLCTILLLCGCGGGKDPGTDGSNTPAATASLSASGDTVQAEATVQQAIAALAITDRTSESWTLHALELTFKGAGGELAMRLEQSDKPMEAGAFVPFGSVKSLAHASWTKGGTEYRSRANPADDTASRVELATLEWKTGGRVAGAADLALVRKDDPTKEVRVAARWDVHLTGGP